MYAAVAIPHKCKNVAKTPRENEVGYFCLE